MAECCSICFDPLDGGKESTFINDINIDLVEDGNNSLPNPRWDGCLSESKSHFCQDCLFQYLQVAFYLFQNEMTLSSQQFLKPI
jgi:hypothetical protein